MIVAVILTIFIFYISIKNNDREFKKNGKNVYWFEDDEYEIGENNDTSTTK